MAEAFEHRVIEPFRIEDRSQLAIRGLRALPSLGVVGEMAVDGAPHYIGQPIAAFHAQRQRQLRSSTKVQSPLPRVFLEPVQSVSIRRIQPQRRQHGGGMRRDSWIRWRQKSNLKANCMRRGSPTENALPKNGPKSGYGPGIPRLG